jgi:hypothetical protein
MLTKSRWKRFLGRLTKLLEFASIVLHLIVDRGGLMANVSKTPAKKVKVPAKKTAKKKK